MECTLMDMKAGTVKPTDCPALEEPQPRKERK